MRKAVESKQDIALALLQYRNVPVTGCENSPAQLVFNRSLRTRIPTMSATTAPDSVRRSLELRQDRQKFYHDQHTRSLSPLQPGDAM